MAYDPKQFPAEDRELRAEVERLTARCIALDGDINRLTDERDEARAKVERLNAAVKEARWQLERAEPQSDMSRVECTSWHDRNLRWLAEHGKEAGDDDKA